MLFFVVVKKLMMMIEAVFFAAYPSLVQKGGLQYSPAIMIAHYMVWYYRINLQFKFAVIHLVLIFYTK